MSTKNIHRFSLGAEDASRLLTSTATTVITTEATAVGSTHVEGVAVNVGGTRTTVEQSASSSSSQSAAAAIATRKH